MRRKFRSLFPWEADYYAAHLLRLSARDRQLRFMGGVSDDFVVKHCRRSLAPLHSKVIGWFDDGTLRAAGELCWSADRIGEAAFSVEAPYRQCGIGVALAHRVIRAAQNRGMTEVVIYTDSRNLAMRRLGTRFGTKFQVESSEIAGTIEIRIANPASAFFEFTDEHYGIMSIALSRLKNKCYGLSQFFH